MPTRWVGSRQRRGGGRQAPPPPRRDRTSHGCSPRQPGAAAPPCPTLCAICLTPSQANLAHVLVVHPLLLQRGLDDSSCFPLGLSHMLATSGVHAYADSSLTVLYHLVRRVGGWDNARRLCGAGLDGAWQGSAGRVLVTGWGQHAA